ncbi:hypothetical protein C5167_011732 [Papaver somniferum]|nr:hypothetical protein C5167_011732 [Papaver somniferum]
MTSRILMKMRLSVRLSTTGVTIYHGKKNREQERPREKVEGEKIFSPPLSLVPSKVAFIVVGMRASIIEGKSDWCANGCDDGG